GNHFITVKYSGDANFQAATATLVQKVHAYATATVLTSSGSGPAVTLTATVTNRSGGTGTPTGMVSFWDGTSFLAQVGLGTNGTAVCNLPALSAGSHSFGANYCSDTMFASSSATLVGVPFQLSGTAMLSKRSFQLTFSNIIGAAFTVLSSTNAMSALRDWDQLGSALEIVRGQFRFTDPIATNGAQKFYRVRSP